MSDNDPQKRPGPRYIALGMANDVDSWRRANGLTRREVITITPRGNTEKLRGLTGDIEVLTFPSWMYATAAVMQAVEEQLAIIRATSKRAPKEQR